MRSLLRLLAIVAVLGSAQGAFAHNVSTSYARIRVDKATVHVQFTFSLLDLHSGPQLDTDKNEKISEEELRAGFDSVLAALNANYTLSAPEPPASIEVERAELQSDSAVKIDLLYHFPHDVAILTVSSTLPKITQPDHQHLLALGDGDDTRQGILDARRSKVEINIAGQTLAEVFWDFIKLGVEHIITGYDHLAFLFGLLLATTTLLSVIKVVTSFTVAHSITLALATFNVVTLPSRLTESLIALSIAYVAIENFTGKTFVHRWKITFLFGLVHGFGFSNVLREMELTRRHLAVSLFSFNLGVEVGQLCFVALVFPLILLVLKSKWKDRVLTASSLVIMSLGFYWFVERALLT